VSRLKASLYAKAIGRPVTLDGPVAVSWPELFAFLWHRGGLSRARGIARGWRLGSCGGRLFVGRGVKLWFPRYLHAGRNVAIGDHSYVNAFSRDGLRLGNDVRIREGAWIQATSTLDRPGTGLTIGDGTYIGPRVVLGAGGGIRIGRHVTFGAGVHVLAENHEFTDTAKPIQSQGVTRAGITIEDDVWVGNAAIILDGVTIGRGSVIGAGSVVTRDVPAESVAVGNPARVIRQRGGAPSA
jgi:acetyltransferase-like isoleucine patch superfamily enzyme